MRRLDEAEPLAAGAARRGLGLEAGLGVGLGENLHHVALLQLGGERGEPAVDPGGQTSLAPVGAQLVGHVDRGGPGREHDLPSLDKHLDLRLREVAAQRLQELRRVGRLLLPVEHPAQPVELLGAGVGGPGGAREAELRGDAVLGGAVHLLRADQHLDRAVLRAADGGVQGAVEVVLRGGDEVLEPAGDGPPEAVHRAQGRVAVGGRAVHHDDDAGQVVRGGVAAGDRVLPDRVEVPGPGGHLGVDPVASQRHPRLGDHVVEVGVPAGPVVHEPGDAGVLLGLQVQQHHVVQVALEGLDAEPVAERDQYLQGLAGDALPGGGRADPEGAHVVQPVGQLDDQDPDVLAGRDDHFAGGLRLGGLAVERLVELGHPVDQVGHLAAEVLREGLEGVAGVLHRVVQQRRDQGGGVHAQLGADLGDRERVGDVRLTALAELPAVHVLRDRVRPAQHRRLRARVDRPVGADHLGDRVCLRVRPAQQRPQSPGQGQVARLGRERAP